jgi:hypothetical protein
MPETSVTELRFGKGLNTFIMDDSFLISLIPSMARQIKANRESLKLEVSAPVQSDKPSTRGIDKLVLFQHRTNEINRMLNHY